MTPHNAPFEVHPVVPSRREWAGLVASVLLHAAIIVLYLLLRPDPPRDAVAARPGENAQPIALNPAVPFQPPDQPRPQPVPERPVPLGPNSNRPDALVPREQGPETPVDPEALATVEPTRDPTPPVEPPPASPTKVPTPADLAASGALGTPTVPWGKPLPDALAGSPTGQPRQTANAGMGTVGRAGVTSTGDNRAWRPSFPEAAGRCVEIPDLGRNPDGSPVLAAVMGRVFDNRGRPLAGAHLMIMGTSFATFSDGGGNYRLEFDPRLLEKCRVQYVRVSADGHASQSLNLAVGREVRSDDVILRRR